MVPKSQEWCSILIKLINVRSAGSAPARKTAKDNSAANVARKLQNLRDMTNKCIAEGTAAFKDNVNLVVGRISQLSNADDPQWELWVHICE